MEAIWNCAAADRLTPSAIAVIANAVLDAQDNKARTSVTEALGEGVQELINAVYIARLARELEDERLSRIDTADACQLRSKERDAALPGDVQTYADMLRDFSEPGLPLRPEHLAELPKIAELIEALSARLAVAEHDRDTEKGRAIVNRNALDATIAERNVLRKLEEAVTQFFDAVEAESLFVGGGFDKKLPRTQEAQEGPKVKAIRKALDALQSTQPSEGKKPFVHTTSDIAKCNDGGDHDFQGWRPFDDGNGGEQVCTKCGVGAQAWTMRVGP